MISETENSDLNRKRIVELEERLRVSEEANRLKDEHITILSSMDIKLAVTNPALTNAESKAELASLQLQLGLAQDKLRLKEIEVLERDRQLQELRDGHEEVRSSYDDLQGRLVGMTVKVGDMEGMRGSPLRPRDVESEAAMERDLHRASQTIRNLEDQIRQMETHMRLSEKSHEGHPEDVQQFFRDLAAELFIDSDTEPSEILSKVRHLRSDMERLKASSRHVDTSRECDGFKESLAGLLGSTFSHCPLNEEGIKERVRALLLDVREKDRTIRSLEERFKTISNHYEKNFVNSKESEVKTRRLEMEYVELKDHLRHLEKELASRDVSLDELRVSQEKFFHFLRRLAATLKVDPSTKEGDFSVIFDVILERTSRAIVEENGRAAGHNDVVVSLQKRVKGLKDQVHSRDLHLELMRKKVATLEDELRDAGNEIRERKTAFEREEATSQKVVKVQQKVEQLRDENKALKAELFELSEVKMLLDMRTNELEALQQKLIKVERTHQRQEERISGMSKDIEARDAQTNETKTASDTAVKSLSSELRNFRSALDRSRKSELELLDFRRVIGRILGLEVDDLAIPNYDIIRHLEKLASIPLSSVTMAVPANHCSMRPGYEEARRLLGRQKINPYTRVYAEAGRPRSVSPIHDFKDIRKY